VVGEAGVVVAAATVVVGASVVFGALGVPGGASLSDVEEHAVAMSTAVMATARYLAMHASLFDRQPDARYYV